MKKKVFGHIWIMWVQVNLNIHDIALISDCADVNNYLVSHKTALLFEVTKNKHIGFKIMFKNDNNK